jgi:hypothetical protein
MADRYTTILEGIEYLSKMKTPLAEKVIELLGEMSQSDRNELKNRVRVIITHLLKWEHQPSKRSNSWKLSAREALAEIEDILLDSPSLVSFITKELGDRVYKSSVLRAARETGMEPKDFPKTNPFDAAKVISDAKHEIFSEIESANPKKPKRKSKKT